MSVESRIVRLEKRLNVIGYIEEDVAATIVNKALGSIKNTKWSDHEMQLTILVGRERATWIIQGLPLLDNPPQDLLNGAYLALLQGVDQLCRRRH